MNEESDCEQLIDDCASPQKDCVYCYYFVAVGIFSSSGRWTGAGSWNQVQTQPGSLPSKKAFNLQSTKNTEGSFVGWGDCQRLILFPSLSVHNINEWIGWRWPCSSVSARVPKCLCSSIQASILPTLIPHGVWIYLDTEALQNNCRRIHRPWSYCLFYSSVPSGRPNQEHFFSRLYVHASTNCWNSSVLSWIVRWHVTCSSHLDLAKSQRIGFITKINHSITHRQRHPPRLLISFDKSRMIVKSQ